MSAIDDKLANLGITLPAPFNFPKPNRTGCVRAGDMLFVSGHGALGITPPEGVRLHGKLGLDMTVEEGQVVARYAMIKMLGTIKGAIGDLDQVRRVVRLFGMVNCAPDFHFMPAVIDGASDLLYELYGERGVHARSAIGVASLPYGSAVEINAEFQVSSRARPYTLRRMTAGAGRTTR
jgi:enamine deaminase RidA (YjgF/YER057c/UK114 family)